jgi:hypothetical protein
MSAQALYQAEDWTDFRTLDTLGRRAGVPVEDLPRVLVKELVDNSYDSGANCEFGTRCDALGNETIYVSDDGPGMDGSPEDIAWMFSVRRPRASTKIIRKPSRGCLGNGLRVVAGAVLATDGTLVVRTRGQEIRLEPQDDGSTTVVSVKPWEGEGTEVEVGFGPGLDLYGNNLFSWADQARRLAGRGETYAGKSSPWWYDSDSFWELLQAGGNRMVRDLVAKDLEGCSEPKAGKITAPYLGRTAASLTREEAGGLLARAQDAGRPVNPERLGAVGALDRYDGYSKPVKGEYETKAVSGKQETVVPCVVEAWARPAKGPSVVLCVNRTPVTARVVLLRDDDRKTHYAIYGCGLRHLIEVGRNHNFELLINVQTPYVPFTSDGKAPDLSRVVNYIVGAAKVACKKAKPPRKEPDDEVGPETNGKWKFRPLPTRRGTQTPEQKQADAELLKEFAGRLLEERSRLDFRPGKRGWCYLLEEHGLSKDEFDKAEKMIDKCRKTGLLPVNFTAEDANRAAGNLERPEPLDPRQYADDRVHAVLHCWQKYKPGSFWDYQDNYVEMMVEKIDLRELFGPICADFHIPIFNARGWSDINSRTAMMRRFKAHQDAGRRGVLLYCGDHDPSGLHISDRIPGNLAELEQVVVEHEDGHREPIGWSAASLTIDRFGLNLDFISANGLTWIDNLKTSGGGDLADPRHPDHNKPYVQNYIKEFEARKVEANALVTRPAQARALCLAAIRKYVSLSGVERYRKWLAKEQEKVKNALPVVLRSAAGE